MTKSMARVSSCSRCAVKTEEEEFILPSGRPEIGTHAKTEEETEWNTGMGLPRHAAPRRRSCVPRRGSPITRSHAKEEDDYERGNLKARRHEDLST